MSDDATVAAATIPMEDGQGASAPLPPALTLETPAAEPAGEPAAVVRVDSPPADAPPDPEQERAGILATLGRERQENRTLKQFREQAAPLLVALQKHPDLLAEIQARESGQRLAPAPAAAPAPPAPVGPSVADLEEFAKDLVLYKADGSGLPDVDAARRIYTRNQQQVMAAVQAAIREQVAPMQQTLQRSQGQSARDAIMQTAKSVGADGPELEQMLDGFLANDPALLSNPQIGIAAIMMARGMKGLTVPGQPGAPAVVGAPPQAPAPVFTERPGARAPAPVVMSPIEQRTARARGMTPEAWGAATAPLVNAPKGQQHIVLEE